MANEALCLSCGFCCDGTLFARFFLDADEAVWARRVRLPLIEDDEGARLLQPCAALGDDRRCRHYEDRPRPCHVFVCRLNVAVEKGEVERDVAEARVARVRELRGRGVGSEGGEARLDAYELADLLRTWFAQAR